MVRPGLFRFPLQTAAIRSVLRLNSTPILPVPSTHTGVLRPAANAGFRYFHHSQPRLSSSSSGGEYEKDEPKLTFSQRLKYLIKSYGWYALGVYFLISTIDFSVAFAAVNLIGAEHVSRVAASAKESVYAIFNSRPPEPGREEMDRAVAQSQTGGREGLYAMIVLAYTIHKTLFLPVRVGLTAVFTPRLVGWLRSRGWAGTQGTRRAAEEFKQRIRRDRD
ncbi:hypothetical protein BDM02DRAFT_3118399 [Thelephora ganbajun]|uniref:Uncharacterized protein n=1 Tax=Thelephora ganbajun TaxID=370292 RepID=A0ACB6ZAK2_THEGA|nr:hypothetical protein BDM02DRAFT_3118399 [Thelephora ganbajun]